MHISGKKITGMIQLARVTQYSKNLLIFIPAFFAAKFFEVNTLINLLATFLAFCCIASSVYIFNDMHDLQEDKLHPEKKLRPLVQKSVSWQTAKIMFFFFVISGFTISLLLKWEFSLLLLLYFLVMISYSLKLKTIALIDVFTIALGFVLRIMAGGLTSNVSLSGWIIITTFLLALFLALGKRRDDVLLFVKTGAKARKAVTGYTQEFLNMTIVIVATTTLLAYIMYTFSPQIEERFHTDSLYLTAVFVLLGILRYLQIIFVEKQSSDPSHIFLRDRLLQAIIFCWLISFAVIIY